MATYRKDPESVLDYAFDWTDWLADSETITAHTVTVPAGITLDSDSKSAGVVTAWLSGGTDGESYRVECLITTSEGRTDERSISLHVRNR